MIPKSESDMVAEVMAECLKNIAALIEGKFIKHFEISFEVDGCQYNLILNKLNK